MLRNETILMHCGIYRFRPATRTKRRADIFDHYIYTSKIACWRVSWGGGAELGHSGQGRPFCGKAVGSVCSFFTDMTCPFPRTLTQFSSGIYFYELLATARNAALANCAPVVAALVTHDGRERRRRWGSPARPRSADTHSHSSLHCRSKFHLVSFQGNTICFCPAPLHVSYAVPLAFSLASFVSLYSFFSSSFILLFNPLS